MLVAIAAPALVTLLALARVSAVVPALLYVGAISAAAAVGGSGPGLLAAVASFFPYTFFFTPPRHTFTISGADDAVALAAFVAVAVGVSQLVARERRVLVRERLANRLAEEAAARTLRLEAVARALADARRPQDVLDGVLTEGLAAAEARAGLIALLSDDGATLEVVAHRGYPAGRMDDWSRFGVDEDLPLAEVVRTGTALYFATTAERDRRFPRMARLRESSHGLAALPLVFEGRTIGGLVLSFPTDEEFDEDRRALKEALAAQAAQALERTRLDEAERQAQERLAFLAEAGDVLASSLDYERTLRRLAELTVPRLADWCVIDVAGDDGSIVRVAIAHRDPAKLRFAEEFCRRYPTDPAAPGGVARVLRAGEPELMAEIDDAALVAAAQGDDVWLGLVRELGLSSSVMVPLVARGRTLGVLSLLTADAARRLTPTEFRLAQDLARRAAIAVDNSRLYAEAERRADAARALSHVTDAVVLVDRESTPRYWNLAAASLFGETDGRLAAWERLPVALGGRVAAESAVTLPVDLGTAERWLQVSSVDFDEGCVFVIRDVTDERMLERTRSEFVATASHELRTPIAAVYGTFQTLLREDLALDRAATRQFLQIGLHESERLTRIVDDLLLTGQLDGGAPTVEPRRCDVGAVVEDVVAATAARLNGTHALVASCDDALSPIRCDPLRLRQVLANLVENAVKYSPDGGTVRVDARAGRSGGARIEVADEGIGIPARDQRRIFERFVRLDPALRRGVGGTGLGLYICRELVERMGGTIAVRSREDEGSTFVVELPAG